MQLYLLDVTMTTIESRVIMDVYGNLAAPMDINDAIMPSALRNRRLSCTQAVELHIWCIHWTSNSFTVFL